MVWGARGAKRTLIGITDGSSNTVMAAGKVVPDPARRPHGSDGGDNERWNNSGWDEDNIRYHFRPLGDTDPRNLPFNDWGCSGGSNGGTACAVWRRYFGSAHTGGLNACFGDGSIKVVRFAVDPLVTTIVYRLAEKTDEAVTIESQSTTVDHNGVVMANLPERERDKRYSTLPPGMAKADYTAERNIIDQGEETVSAIGREFRAKWVKDKGATEAGPMIATTWTSDEAPGGIIKSFSQTEDGKVTITIELTELTVPK